jgi:HEPN domain-containing protein
MKESVNYWVSSAKDNLVVARKLLRDNEPIWMGFMCHLVIEKSLKALIAESLDEGLPPRIHDLGALAIKCGVDQHLDDSQRKLLGKLTPMNIEARYAVSKDELTLPEAKKMLTETEALHLWLTSRLSS